MAPAVGFEPTTKLLTADGSASHRAVPVRGQHWTVRARSCVIGPRTAGWNHGQAANARLAPGSADRRQTSDVGLPHASFYSLVTGPSLKPEMKVIGSPSFPDSGARLAERGSQRQRRPSAAGASRSPFHVARQL